MIEHSQAMSVSISWSRLRSLSFLSVGIVDSWMLPTKDIAIFTLDSLYLPVEDGWLSYLISAASPIQSIRPLSPFNLRVLTSSSTSIDLIFSQSSPPTLLSVSPAYTASNFNTHTPLTSLLYSNLPSQQCIYRHTFMGKVPQQSAYIRTFADDCCHAYKIDDLFAVNRTC